MLYIDTHRVMDTRICKDKTYKFCLDIERCVYKYNSCPCPVNKLPCNIDFNDACYSKNQRSVFNFTFQVLPRLHKISCKINLKTVQESLHKHIHIHVHSATNMGEAALR